MSTAIKTALSRDDLTPDIEEKLVQLQKYNSEQTKKDDPSSGLLSVASAAASVSSTTTSANAVSSRSSGTKRVREQQVRIWCLLCYGFCQSEKM